MVTLKTVAQPIGRVKRARLGVARSATTSCGDLMARVGHRKRLALANAVLARCGGLDGLARRGTTICVLLGIGRRARRRYSASIELGGARCRSPPPASVQLLTRGLARSCSALRWPARGQFGSSVGPNTGCSRKTVLSIVRSTPHRSPAGDLREAASFVASALVLFHTSGGLSRSESEIGADPGLVKAGILCNRRADHVILRVRYCSFEENVLLDVAKRSISLFPFFGDWPRGLLALVGRLGIGVVPWHLSSLGRFDAERWLRLRLGDEVPSARRSRRISAHTGHVPLTIMVHSQHDAGAPHTPAHHQA